MNTKCALDVPIECRLKHTYANTVIIFFQIQDTSSVHIEFFLKREKSRLKKIGKLFQSFCSLIIWTAFLKYRRWPAHDRIFQIICFDPFDFGEQSNLWMSFSKFQIETIIILVFCIFMFPVLCFAVSFILRIIFLIRKFLWNFFFIFLYVSNWDQFLGKIQKQFSPHSVLWFHIDEILNGKMIREKKRTQLETKFAPTRKYRKITSRIWKNSSLNWYE